MCLPVLNKYLYPPTVLAHPCLSQPPSQRKKLPLSSSPTTVATSLAKCQISSCLELGREMFRKRELLPREYRDTGGNLYTTNLLPYQYLQYCTVKHDVVVVATSLTLYLHLFLLLVLSAIAIDPLVSSSNDNLAIHEFLSWIGG